MIVSSWRRAEYLDKCFKALKNARGIQDKQIWVFQNNRVDDDVNLEPVHAVIGLAGFEFEHFRVTTQNHRNVTQAQYNAWEAAYNFGAPLVYFIVDDAIVTPDFFEWHEAVQADGDWTGSTAWRPDKGNTKPFDPAAYYQAEFPTEIGVGFCAKHDKIPTFLASPPDWYPVPRMIEEKWCIAMPYVPRAYHIGAQSSHLGSGINMGSAIDVLPDPIPDYGKQKVVLK